MKQYLLLLLLPLALASCSIVRDTLGVDEQKGPDEFDVATAPPLAIPPDFTLRPPEPGAPRPQAINPQDTAKELLTGSGDAPSTGDAQPSAANTLTASGAEDALVNSVAEQAAQGNATADNTIATTLDEGARVQGILEAPVTRNEAGKLPTIEMEDKGGPFWDSWF